MSWWRPRRAASVSRLSFDGKGSKVELHWVDGIEVASSSSPADWVAPRLLPWGNGMVHVGSVVPIDFEAYVRVDHVVVGRDDEPQQGSLPRPVAEALVALLTQGRHADRCWLAVWAGWGDLPPAPTVVRHPGRDYVLLVADAAAAARPLWSHDGDAWSYQGASLWWPETRSWCVATEIDFTWTYVGASEALVQRLLDDDRLVARRVNVADDANT